jgi:hypothetical protein
MKGDKDIERKHVDERFVKRKVIDALAGEWLLANVSHSN